MKKKLTLTAQYVQIIQNNDVAEFERILKTSELPLAAAKYLFENGTPEIIKTFFRISYPIGNLFRIYQKYVMRYADKKTLVTYFMYHNLKPIGEIELIKRNETNPFLCYTNSNRLSSKAFKFLLEHGSPEINKAFFTNCSSLSDNEFKLLLKLGSSEAVRAFLLNCELYGQQLRMLLKHGNLDYIKAHIIIATSAEIDKVYKVARKMKNPTLLDSIDTIIYGRKINCDYQD